MTHRLLYLLMDLGIPKSVFLARPARQRPSSVKRCQDGDSPLNSERLAVLRPYLGWSSDILIFQLGFNCLQIQRVSKM